MKKKILIAAISVLAAVICACGFAGCTSDKTFEKEGMQITLTTQFTEKELLSQTAYYESRDAIVCALKEEFALADGLSEYSVSEYTDAVLAQNSISATTYERDGQAYMYFTYQKTVSGKEFFYLATTHKSDDAFWLIQFACAVSDRASKEQTFFKWADTITFTSQAED